MPCNRFFHLFEMNGYLGEEESYMKLQIKNSLFKLCRLPEVTFPIYNYRWEAVQIIKAIYTHTL